MNSDYKNRGHNPVNFTTWNFNPGAALYKNAYNFQLLFT